MIIYEVSIQIKPERKEEFLSWTKSHIKDVLSSNNFRNALFFEEKEFENVKAISHKFVVHYIVNSHSDLENYLKNFAPKLRQEGLNQFGEDIQISRRLLESSELRSFS